MPEHTIPYVMSIYEWVRLTVWIVGVPIIILLCVSAVRKVRAIGELDAYLKAEAERNRQNPYAQMAELLEAQELLKPAKRVQEAREKR